jgi:hypothetical protein
MDDLDGAYIFLVPADLEYTVVTSGTMSGTLTLSVALPLDRETIQGVVYADVPVSEGSRTTSLVGREVSDWTMQLDGGGALAPTWMDVVELPLSEVFLPVVHRAH